VRSWFRAAGSTEISFDGAPEPFGVGVNQLADDLLATPPQPPSRLFSFATA
jgi:hypothetical protein